MKRLLQIFLIMALVVAAAAYWKHTQRRAKGAKGAATLLPLNPSVDAGLLGEGGAAVDAKGRVWVWGEVRAVVFGTPITSPPRREALRAEGIEDVVQVAVGQGRILALMRDGTVRATGCNGWGALGLPAIPRNACTKHDEWLPLPGLDQVTQLAAGSATSFAVRRDGSVWGWGRADLGALGPGTTEAIRFRPAPVAPLSGVKALILEFGDNTDAVHYALKQDGSVWAWGTAFRLGVSQPGGPRGYGIEAPVAITGLGPVAALPPHPQAYVLGGAMAAVRSDGSVVHFGGPSSAMCNRVDGEPLPLPHTVPGMSGIAEVGVTGGSVLGRGRDGSLWRWGDLRMDSTTQPGQGCMDKAEQLLPPGSVTALSASGLSALAWLTQGGVLAWGHDLVLNAGTSGLPQAWTDRQIVKGPR